MIDWIRENVLLVFLGIFVLVAGGVWLADRLPGRQPIGPESPARTPSDATERTAQIQRLRHKDALEAVALADAVLANPTHKAEREQALALLPGALEYAVYNRLQTNAWEEAQAFLERLTRDFPAASETRVAQRAWGESLGRRWEQAADAGRDEEADAFFRQVQAGGFMAGFRTHLARYQEYKIHQWEKARAAGNLLEAQDRLLEAASVLEAADLRNPLVDRLRQDSSWDTKDLCKFAQHLAQRGLKAQAFSLFSALLYRLQDHGAEAFDPAAKQDANRRQAIRSDLERQTAEGLLHAAALAQSGDPSLVTAADPLDFCELAMRISRDRSIRVKALRQEFEIKLAKFNETAAPVLALELNRLGDTNYPAAREIYEAAYAGAQQAEKIGRDLLHKIGMDLWRLKLDDPGFDPWPLVPPSVAEPIREDARYRDETLRRERLLKLAAEQAYSIPLPELAPVRDTLMQVLARWGLMNLRETFTSAFPPLRTAIRETLVEALRDDIRHALEDFIRGKSKARDFDALYDLSGFYVSEFGFRDQDEAFRREFLALLDQTAKALQRQAPMKHIFLLSLVAEFFPEEPAGAKARQEATRLAFEAVTQYPTQDTDRHNPPTALSGLSVVSLDNNTEYHLLSFYQGAESFFARIGPYARGVIVLKNGDYRLAVITTSAEIVPYGESLTLNSEIKKASYRISVQGGAEPSTLYQASASGDFRLLRAPGDPGVFSLNPKTGTVVLRP